MWVSDILLVVFFSFFTFIFIFMQEGEHNVNPPCIGIGALPPSPGAWQTKAACFPAWVHMDNNTNTSWLKES